MEQTREELLRLAFNCLGRAASLLEAAGKDLMVIEVEQRRVYGGRTGPARVPRSKTSLPAATRLTGSGVDSPWRR
jgi:hypothetical protein